MGSDEGESINVNRSELRKSIIREAVWKGILPLFGMPDTCITCGQNLQSLEAAIGRPACLECSTAWKETYGEQSR